MRTIINLHDGVRELSLHPSTFLVIGLIEFDEAFQMLPVYCSVYVFFKFYELQHTLAVLIKRALHL